MHSEHDLPIACTLTPGELANQRDRLLPGLLTKAIAQAPIADGFSYSFEPSKEILEAIIGTIERERRCCQFLRFQLTIEPALGPVRLDVTGPPGTQEFLKDL